MESTTYREARSALGNDRASCVPIAMAIVSRRDVRAVNNAMIAKKIRRPNCGVYAHHWLEFAKTDLGLELEDVTNAIRAAGGKTVRSVEQVLNRNYTYLIRVRRHLLSYRDGRIHDWSQGRKNRIVKVYRVVNAPESKRPAVPVAEPATPAPKHAVKEYLNGLFELGYTPCQARKRASATFGRDITYGNVHYHYRNWRAAN